MSKCPENTLIGVLDGEITDAHTIDWTVNKIGGLPISFPSEKNLDGKFSCKICGNLLALVTQTYCPLDGSKYHRILQIYACISKKCWNKSESWLALRKQFYFEDEQSEISSNCKSVPKNTWLLEDDDWGDSFDDKDHSSPLSQWNSQLAECSMETANLSLSDKGDFGFDRINLADQSLEKSLTEEIEDDNIVVCGGNLSEKQTVPNWLSNQSEVLELRNEFQPVLKEFFLSVISEPTEEQHVVENQHLTNLIQQYKKTDNSSISEVVTCGFNVKNGEKYEETEVRHGDKDFHKFMKILTRCPQQVIRYSWNGKPTFISKCKAQDTLKCKNCGSDTNYEMQLMPPLVNFLKLTNIDFEATPLEFGTVIVFSCEKSCWNDNDSYREEYIFVQADSDEQLFNSFSK